MTTKMVSHAANIGSEFSSDDEAVEVHRKPTSQQARSNAVNINVDSLGDLNASTLDLNDDQILEMLDRFGIQHGPVVESTRTLYKRVLIKYLKDQQQTKNDQHNIHRHNHQQSSHPEAQSSTGQMSQQQKPQQKAQADVYSSDEDDIVYTGTSSNRSAPSNEPHLQSGGAVSAVTSAQTKQKQTALTSKRDRDRDLKVWADSQLKRADTAKKMVIDQSDPLKDLKEEMGQFLGKKTSEVYTDEETEESTDEDDEQDEFDETDDEEWNALDDDEAMDIDHVDNAADGNKEAKNNRDVSRKQPNKTDVSSKLGAKSGSSSNNEAPRPRVKVTPMRPITVKQQAPSQQIAATSTTAASTKKPFTRSQRAAASSASSTTKSATATKDSDSVANATEKSSRFLSLGTIFSTLLVAIIALLFIYYFRHRLFKSGGKGIPAISGINFNNFKV